MTLNWKEIDKIVEEISPQGAQIQECIQSNIHSIYLQCYKKREFWIRFQLSQPLIGICEDKKPSKPDYAQRFQTFLRANIKNSYIETFNQYGKERVIELVCVRKNKRLTCIIPLWAGKANFIVCDENLLILEACYRKPQQGVIAGATYSFPKQSESIPAKDIRPHDPPLSKYIATRIRKLESEKKASERIQIENNINKQLTYRQSLITKKERQIPSEEHITHEIYLGNMLLMHRADWHPGLETLEAYDPESQTKISIPLDAHLSFKKNTEAYFNRSRKLKSKQKNLSLQITTLKKEIEALHKDMEQIKDMPATHIPKKYQGQKQPPRQPKKSPTYSGKRYKIEGFDVYVGRDAQQNEKLIRNIARGNDIWLHARDFPGSHVIVKRASRQNPIPKKILSIAAQIALFFSKGRNNGRGDVYMCAVKHLRKKKHGVFGQYIPHHEENIFVSISDITSLLTDIHTQGI